MYYLSWRESLFHSSHVLTVNITLRNDPGKKWSGPCILVICKKVDVCMCMLSCVWLIATLWTVACQAPLTMEIFRQEYWNGLPFPTPGDLPNPGIKPTSVADSLLMCHLQCPRKVGKKHKKPMKDCLSAHCEWSEVAQLYPLFCNPMDCSLPGFSVHGIFQARVLEWVAISFSRGSSRLGDWTQVSHVTGRRFTL